MILGRDLELAEIRRFLGSVPAGPSVLFLEGVAGIRKTTLWLEGIADARRMGYRLWSRGGGLRGHVS